MCSLHMPWLRTTPNSMLCHQKSTKPLLYLEKKLQGQFGWDTAAAAAFRITLNCLWIQQDAWIPHYTPLLCAVYSLTCLYKISLQTPVLFPSTMLLHSFLVFSTQFLSQPFCFFPFHPPQIDPLHPSVSMTAAGDWKNDYCLSSTLETTGA